MRSSDTVSRFGGDEFVVVLSQVDAHADAVAIARKLLQGVAAPHRIAGRRVTVAGSLGLAISPEHGRDAVTLIANADAAMYRAKRAGAGRYEVVNGDEAPERPACRHPLADFVARRSATLRSRRSTTTRSRPVPGASSRPATAPYTGPMNWLVKEEPSHYNFAQFAQDGRTVWSGVRNPVAQRHLRSMTQGDRVFYYHTGDEKAIVGTARVAGAPYPDPDDPDGQAPCRGARPASAPLPAPVTLKAVKADARFADFALVRVPRLSVMPVTDAQWAILERMARG